MAQMKTKTNKMRESLVQRYIESLSKSEIPWRKGWYSNSRPYNINGRKYRGGNVLMLNYVANVEGYDDPRWMTFNQLSGQNWQFKKNIQAFVPLKFDKSIYDSFDKNSSYTLSIKEKDAVVSSIHVSGRSGISNIDPLRFTKMNSGNNKYIILLEGVKNGKPLSMDFILDVAVSSSSQDRCIDIDVSTSDDRLIAKPYFSSKGLGVNVEYWFPYDKVNKKSLTWSEYNMLATDDKKDCVLTFVNNTVFNASVIDGVPELEIKKNPDIVASPFIDNLIDNLGVRYVEAGDRAFYSPINDSVTIPPKDTFISQYEYDTTRLHELCHSTGHPTRLNRDLSGNFGSESYAKEELRAEIGSSFVAMDIGLNCSYSQQDNHIAYIQSWIKVLENDPDELFRAISDASGISEYILEVGDFENFIVKNDLCNLKYVENSLYNDIIADALTTVAIFDSPSGSQYAIVMRDDMDPHFNIYQITDKFEPSNLAFGEKIDLNYYQLSIEDYSDVLAGMEALRWDSSEISTVLEQ